MAEETIKEMIKRHEGFRDKVYLDHLGNPTIGYGHCFNIDSKLPVEILDAIFEYDYSIAEKDYDKLELDLDDRRKGAIIDMLFNMGYTRLSKFKIMMASLKRKDFARAAEELSHSRYFTQVPVRAAEIRDIILNG